MNDPVAGRVGLLERRLDDGVDFLGREPQARVVGERGPQQLPELPPLDRPRLSQVVEPERERGLLLRGRARVEDGEPPDKLGEVEDGVLGGVEKLASNEPSRPRVASRNA